MTCRLYALKLARVTCATSEFVNIILKKYYILKKNYLY